jgi:alkaline phosphatase D
LLVRPAPKETATVAYSIGRQSYYRLRIGNCEFFCCDTRTNRQMHDTREPDKPGLSMLGQRQKKWLLDGMRNSDADFLFVVSSVNFMVPHVGGGKVRTTNKDDAWTVFFDEREQLIAAWDKLGKPVCVLTGDLHNSFVIKITDRVWEFASGPHNSNNQWSSDEGGRPATGRLQSDGSYVQRKGEGAESSHRQLQRRAEKREKQARRLRRRRQASGGQRRGN